MPNYHPFGLYAAHLILNGPDAARRYALGEDVGASEPQPAPAATATAGAEAPRETWGEQAFRVQQATPYGFDAETGVQHEWPCGLLHGAASCRDAGCHRATPDGAGSGEGARDA